RIRRALSTPLFPYTTLFRSVDPGPREGGDVTMKVAVIGAGNMGTGLARSLVAKHEVTVGSRDPEKAQSVARELGAAGGAGYADADRKSTRLNSSHVSISYAV